MYIIVCHTWTTDWLWISETSEGISLAVLMREYLAERTTLLPSISARKKLRILYTQTIVVQDLTRRTKILIRAYAIIRLCMGNEYQIWMFMNIRLVLTEYWSSQGKNRKRERLHICIEIFTILTSLTGDRKNNPLIHYGPTPCSN